jgi:uncharacterized protein YcbX
MEIAEIWRYPVKSMAGEQLRSANLGVRGLTGDRGIAAFDRQSRRPDHPVSARGLPGLLRFRAVCAADGAVVTGPDLPPTPWRHPAVANRLREVCQRPLELAEVVGGAFDDSPLHLVLLPSVIGVAAAVNRHVDPRRFRANLFIAADPGQVDAEREWLGAHLHIGAAVVRVLSECARCVVTTRDPDTYAGWPGLLRHLVETRQAMMGVYAEVVVPGRIAPGSPVVVES